VQKSVAGTIFTFFHKLVAGKSFLHIFTKINWSRNMAATGTEKYVGRYLYHPLIIDFFLEISPTNIIMIAVSLAYLIKLIGMRVSKS